MLDDKEKEQWAYEMLHWHGIDIYGINHNNIDKTQSDNDESKD